MITKIYIHSNKDSNIEKGEELGFYNFNVWRHDPRLEVLLGMEGGNSK